MWLQFLFRAIPFLDRLVEMFSRARDRKAGRDEVRAKVAENALERMRQADAKANEIIDVDDATASARKRLRQPDDPGVT